MSIFSIVALTLNAVALIAAASWTYASPDFEPLITTIALVVTLAGKIQSIRREKSDSIALQTLSTFQRNFSDHFSDHLIRMEFGFNQEKQVRAARFVTQNGSGNEKFKTLLEFAFKSLETGLLNAYKAKSFEELCKEGGVTVERLESEDKTELWLFQNKNRLQMFWTGGGLFDAGDRPSFGAYGKDKHLFLSEQAFSDFNRIHSLFLAYVDDTIPPSVLNIEITRDGIVPSNI